MPLSPLHTSYCFHYVAYSAARCMRHTSASFKCSLAGLAGLFDGRALELAMMRMHRCFPRDSMVTTRVSGVRSVPVYLTMIYAEKHEQMPTLIHLSLSLPLSLPLSLSLSLSLPLPLVFRYPRIAYVIYTYVCCVFLCVSRLLSLSPCLKSSLP